MKNTINTIQLIIATIGGYIGYFLGDNDGLIYALTIFIIIDYITGLMVAILEKKISSDIGFRGTFKKILIFAFVGIGNIIDIHLKNNGSAIRTTVVFFYLSNEGISIIENATKIGLPIPQKLKDILEQTNSNITEQAKKESTTQIDNNTTEKPNKEDKNNG